MRHLHYEERLQRLGLHSLQRRRLRAGPIPVWILIRIFFSLLTAGRGSNWHPYKVLHSVSHRRRRGSAFSVKVNKLTVSVVIAPSVNVSKKRLERVWTEVFPHLPHWLNIYLPISHPFHPACTPPINSYHFYMLPNSLFCLCGFFRFLHYHNRKTLKVCSHSIQQQATQLKWSSCYHL